MTEEEYLKEIASNQKKIRGFIKSLHYYPSEVDDILQETNVTLIKKYEKYDGSKNFKPWAMAVARWTWMAYKQKRRRALSRLCYVEYGSEFEGENWDVIDPVSCSNEIKLKEDKKNQKNLLNKISKKLSKNEKIILNMCSDGKTISEIAERINSSYTVTCARKRRLLIKIKKMVEDETSVLIEK